MSKFSDFIRKASPEKREEIMAKVMDDADAEQAKMIYPLHTSSMVEKLPDKERWLALLSYNECWLTKEDANGIADWIRSETTEVSSRDEALKEIVDTVAYKHLDHLSGKTSTHLIRVSGSHRDQVGQKGYTAEDESSGIKDVDSKSRMGRSKKPGEETSGIKDTQNQGGPTQNGDVS